MAQRILVLLCYLAIVGLSSAVYTEDPTSKNGYRLAQGAGYLIVSPRTVRPDMTFRLRVTIYNMPNKALNVVAHLSQDGHQYARATVWFEHSTTKQMELDVPDSIGPGEHRLVIEGMSTAGGQSAADVIFRNETVMGFHSKYRSIFAKTDKPLYLVLEGVDSVTIKFRIVAVTPDLIPVMGPITIYVLDSKGIAVRRWRNEQLNIGLYENEFTLMYPFNTGNWTIRVEAFGHIYDKTFIVDFRFRNKIQVNVTTPQRLFDTDWALLGTIWAEHSASFMNAEGNATLILTVEDTFGKSLEGNITQTIHHISKETSFVFPLADIKKRWGDVTGYYLRVTGFFYDWFVMITRKGFSVTRLIKDGIKVSVLGRDHRAFKPDQPIVIYFTVTRTDGSPYKGFFFRQLDIHVTRIGISTVSEPEDKVVIPDNGMVRYEIMPAEQDESIIVRASHQSSLDGTRETRFFRHHNRNGNYLKVSTSTEDPQVDRYIVFTVKTNFLIDEIQYVITTRANILLGSSLRMSGTQKTFSIAASREMTPFGRLVVYCIIQGSVVTDSITFPVKDLRLLSEASLTLNQGKDFHRRTIELKGHSHGGGTMIISGYQYEFLERGIQAFLTADDVMYDLMEYKDGTDKPFHKIWYHDSYTWEHTDRFVAQTNGMDALQTFNTSGLFVFSDMNVTDVPELADAECNITFGLGRCPSGQCYEIAKRCDQVLDCIDGYDELDCELDIPIRRREAFMIDMKYSARLYQPMDWLFKHQWIKPDGNVEMQIDVPKSTQVVAIGGIALHPTEGLTIIPDLILYDTTRLFFMKFECPKTIRRGEQVGVRTTIFNNQDEAIEVLVTLHGSEDYKMVKVGPHGYTSSYSPEMLSGDVQVMVYIEPRKMKYLHFPVWSVQNSGEFDVHVTGYTFYDSDTVSCHMNVEYDGIACQEFTPYLIDLVNEGSIIIPDVEIVIPEQFYHPEEPFHRYVPGSETSHVHLFGDIVSPGFYQTHWSSKDTTGLEHDTADGFISDFAFNLQTMKYLESVNALEYDEAEIAMDFMRSVLAQIYVYLHPDGGMRMFQFTGTDKPSIWVTLFGLRWLHEAASSQWNEELYIPIYHLNNLAKWLARQQHPDGSYEEVHTIYDPNHVPITIDANGTEHVWFIPLTADTAITLCSLSTFISGSAKVLSDAAAQRSAEYLAGKLPYLTNPYQLSLTAYALHVCGHPSKDRAFHMLHDIRREGEFIYWSQDEIEKNMEYIMNNVPIRLPRADFVNLNHAVTATSYALMLYMRREGDNYKKMTVPMMRWLNEERNGPWSWASNRDTLLALQALTEFAMHDQNRFVYFMRITSVSTHSPGWEMTHNLNSSNFDISYEEQIPVSHGYVKTKASGTGYAMFSVNQILHVERQEQLDNPDYESFEITIPKLYFWGRNFSVMEMEVCFKFIRPDIADKAHLTMVAIELPTGYVPSWWDILKVYDSAIEGIREVNFRERHLHVFLEYIYVDREVCVSFRADRWYPVANMTIQQVIRMNSYMETAIMWGQIYTTYSLHNLHICLVCGSYQCPYCPYFNHATSCISSKLLPVLLAIMTSLWITRRNKIFDRSWFDHWR